MYHDDGFSVLDRIPDIQHIAIVVFKGPVIGSHLIAYNSPGFVDDPAQDRMGK